jgi:hypothetical protein
MAYPKNRVSHVVWCVKPENFDAARDFWAGALGVRFDEIELPPETGLRVVYAPDNGVEIITPSSDPPPADIARFLENGEGVYTVVYSVPDVEASAQSTHDHGIPVIRALSYTGLLPWDLTYETLEERVLEPTWGMRITLGEIEPR